jgi:transposase-like protein
VARKRVARYPLAFRREAVERMKECNNITELAQELGLTRISLYQWREQLDPDSATIRNTVPIGSRAGALERQVGRLKRALADKTLELDFFKGALQKVEARRRQKRDSGGKTSTTTSGK